MAKKVNESIKLKTGHPFCPSRWLLTVHLFIYEFLNILMRKHWVRLWQKMLVLRQSIQTRHFTILYNCTYHLNPKSKLNELKKKKKKGLCNSCFLCILKPLLPSSSIHCLPEPTPHHTPPHRSPELLVELVNSPEPPWAMIQRFVFHDLPFFPWISIFFFSGFMGFFGASWTIYGFFFFFFLGILMGWLDS